MRLYHAREKRTSRTDSKTHSTIQTSNQEEARSHTNMRRKQSYDHGGDTGNVTPIAPKLISRVTSPYCCGFCKGLSAFSPATLLNRYSVQFLLWPQSPGFSILSWSLPRAQLACRKRWFPHKSLLLSF